MPLTNGANNTSKLLGNITVPDVSGFADDVAKQLSKSAGIAAPELIKLGNPASTGSIDSLYLASNPNYIYYTTQGDEASGVNFIPRDIVPLQWQRPNKSLLILKVGKSVVCLGAAGLVDEVFGETSGAAGTTQTPVSTSQFDFAVLQPYAGTMFAVVKGAIYGDNGYADVATAAFDSSPNDTLANPIDIPTTANKAIGVLVQLDPATGALSYKQSAEFPASISLAQAYLQDLLPLRDTGLKRVGYVKLSNGIESLDNASVWPCPEFFPDIPEIDASALTDFGFAAATTLTIASGVITPTQAYHLVDTQGAAATDDLDTITAGTNGQMLFLRSVSNARVPTIRHGTGNIRSGGLNDIELNQTYQVTQFQCDGTNWNVIGYHAYPNDLEDWGSWPDSDTYVALQDSTGTLYRVRGDELRLWANYHTNSSYSTDMTSMMNVIFNDTTSRTVTVNSSSVIEGHSIRGLAEQIEIGVPHKILLPSGVTWDGTNRAVLIPTTVALFDAVAISTTKFRVFDSTGCTFAAS